MTTPNAPKIREAVLADVPALQAMFAQFVASTQYRAYVGDDPDYSSGLIERLIVNPEGAIFVADTDGEVIGMLGIAVYQHPFSGKQMAVEAFWWLNPERRGYGAFLAKRAIGWAREKGALAVDMMCPCGNTSVAKVYKALGFDPVETTWRKML